MAKPNTRQKLIDYCLRSLGHPVIEINIDEDQLEDRIDEAIQYYQEYHGDAVVRNLRKHKVTNSSLVVNSTGNIAIAVGNIIEDETTGAKAVVSTISGDNVSSRMITYDNVTTPGLKFSAGNNVIVNSETHPIVGTPVQGDIENGFIEVPNSSNILSINNVFNTSNSQTAGIFSVDYQIHLNDIFDLNAAHGGIVNYEMTKQYMSLIDRNINGMYEMIEWSRHKNRVNFHSDTLKDMLDQYVVLDGYEALDPETYTDVYNDAFLKKYVTALFKRQWGLNLIKFEGMTLPGGVTLNGRQIFDDAKEEIQQLEETMQLKHEMPPLDFIG
jgi:hypothetical protein